MGHYFLLFNASLVKTGQKRENLVPEKRSTQIKFKIVQTPERKNEKPKTRKKKHSSNSKVSFQKISKFLRNNKVDEQNAYSGNGEELTGSSKGIHLTEMLFERINYNNDFFDCNISGKVSAFVVFNRDGFFNERRSRLLSNSPYLKVHTVQELRKIRLPANIRGGANVNLIIEYIRVPAASHSHRFVTGNTYYMQVLSNDINKGSGSRLDATDCSEAKLHKYRKDQAWGI